MTAACKVYAMTQSRKTLRDRAHAATFHCVASSVRRSWLCGFDDYAKKSFEHRKPWVEDRISELGDIFACGICAYAVMSNHYHLSRAHEPGDFKRMERGGSCTPYAYWSFVAEVEDLIDLLAQRTLYGIGFARQFISA